MIYKWLLYALPLFALLTGCASVPTTTLDAKSAATEFQPPQGKASLFIYRNEVFGAAFPLRISINNKDIGQTAAKTYFRLEAKPGEYTITSLAEDTSSITLHVDAGKNYFIWQEVTMGIWSPRSQLHIVDEEKGRSDLKDCSLISTPVYAVDPARNASDTKLLELESRLRELGKMHDSKLILLC